MKKKLIFNTDELYQFVLTPDSVAEALEKIRIFMRSGKMKEDDINMIASSFERALTTWAEKYDGREAAIHFEKKFRHYQIEFVLPETEPLDPYRDENETGDNYYSEVNHNLSDSYAYVMYTYHRGGNKLIYSFLKRVNSSVPMIVSLLAAVLFGLLLRFVFPEFGAKIIDGFFDPVCTKFIRVLTMFASPMMFFMLVSTICKLGTRRELSDMGKKLIDGIWLTVLSLTAIVTILCMIAFGVRVAEGASDGSVAGQFAAIRDLLLNIIPDSVIEPFMTGNALQIVFLAIVIGFTVFIKKTQNGTLLKFTDQMRYVFEDIMRVLNAMMPIYIFLSLTSLIVTVDFAQFADMWKLLALFVAMLVVYYAILLLRIVLVAKQSPTRVIKAILPAYLKALTTASSLAAINDSLACSKDSFGIPEKQTAFYVNTGRTVYKAASTCNYILIACFFAYMSGAVNMTAPWYLIAMITCLILGIATPPIPGGAKTCYTILFLQLGIPAIWLALVISIDTIFDFFCTASDVAGLQIQLLSVHEKGKRRALKDRSLI